MKKPQRHKKQKQFDDSAQENMELEYQRKKYRNTLLDAMFDSGIVKYAALLKDQPEHNLFCGQVGEVQATKVSKNPEKDRYFLTFIDFDNDGHDIIRCVVKKENLLPLFCFDPTEYEQTEVQLKGELGEENCTIKKIRDYWDDFEVHEISKEKLKNHTRSDTRFEIGQVVTVEIDFEQKMSNNKVVIIQAGQTGIISNDSTNIPDMGSDIVEVTFWSMSFGLLASERKELVSNSLSQNLASVASSSNTDSAEDSFDLGSLVTSPWEKIIRIHKDYVFPLYCETLQ